MEATSDQRRTFRISFETQVNDGLVSSEDLIDYLQSKMKVKNSSELAKRVLEFSDNTTSIEITTDKKNVEKKNLKLYLKRYLRSKELKNFIKITGDSADGYSFEYINKVDDDE